MIGGSEAVLRSTGALPGFLKERAARLAAGPRMYNLTVSNVPGPRSSLYVAGAEVESIYPVIPIGDHHALADPVFDRPAGPHEATAEQVPLPIPYVCNDRGWHPMMSRRDLYLDSRWVRRTDRDGWAPEWEAHLCRLTERAKKKLPLFEDGPPDPSHSTGGTGSGDGDCPIIP